MDFITNEFSSKSYLEQIPAREAAAAATSGGGGVGVRRGREAAAFRALAGNHRAQYPCGNLESSTCVTLNGSGIQLAVGPQPLWLRNHNSRLAYRIMYNQDLGLIHSTNGNHLESPNEGSSIDHQVTIYLHAQNITMFPTYETWYFASLILVSCSGGLILILTAQSTRNLFRIHSDY
ncbi:putative disease resistance protein-like [Dorcoceras hygrometricum]|uniref:Putative disease resistance protein-like n=1 Tax=Dorcoceras hygrometricum TaxID=472368 RepID=A0A2Z7B202_9LAMI|nr:putative disease resistance protein-like [Dorcoceras hygrometricum]